MFKKMNEKEIDKKTVNDVLSLSKKFLKLAYLLLIVLGIYAITKLAKEWSIWPFFLTIVKIVAPLFVGLLIAWLFDPFVKKMQRKGIKRGFGAAITYLLLIGGIMIVIAAILPILSEQINEFAKNIPQIFDSIKDWVGNLFGQLSGIENFDAEGMKLELFKKMEEFGTGLAHNLPDITVNFLKSFFSGMGTLVVGLIIGFYLLVSFDGAGDALMGFVPKKMRKDTRDLSNEINTSLRKYVLGAVLDCTFVFIITSIGLSIIGLKGSLLFGLFCGLTNIIPYAGPYIGGAPAVIVGFAQGPTTGILTLIVIAIIQFLEGNFLQPLIMSKTTKLHPVTIMLGLLIFGHFWGMFGMIISTPVITVLKSVFLYFDDKFGLLHFED